MCADLEGHWSGRPRCRPAFAAEEPSVFLAEGLLGYLESSEVHRLLGCISARLASRWELPVWPMSAAGRPSTLPTWRSWFQRLRPTTGIANARFGTDNPEGLLAVPRMGGPRDRSTEMRGRTSDDGLSYPSIPRRRLATCPTTTSSSGNGDSDERWPPRSAYSSQPVLPGRASLSVATSGAQSRPACLVAAQATDEYLSKVCDLLGAGASTEPRPRTRRRGGRGVGPIGGSVKRSVPESLENSPSELPMHSGSRRVLVAPSHHPGATSFTVQPGVRLASSIHSCSSGRCTSSTVVTLTYRVRSVVPSGGGESKSAPPRKTTFTETS